MEPLIRSSTKNLAKIDRFVNVKRTPRTVLLLLNNHVLTLLPKIVWFILIINIIGYMCAGPDDSQCSKEEIEYIGNFCRNHENPTKSTPYIESLHDILPEICSYLKIKDLHAVRQTCKSFLRASDYELLRRGPEIKILPIIRNYEEERDFGDIIGVKPKTAIFFTNDKILQDAYDCVSRELISHYTPELPLDCSVVHLEGLSVIKNQSDVDASNDEALGLFFPEISKPNQKRVIIHNYMFMSSKSIPFHIPQLKNSEKNHRKAILIFNLQTKSMDREGCSYYTCNIENLQNLEDEITKIHIENPDRLALWGGNIQWIFVTGPEGPHLSQSFYMTMISGPGVKSWSIFFDLTWPKSMIDNKLQEFKNAIHYHPSRSVALSLQTTYYEEELEKRIAKNSAFAKKFPDLEIQSFGIDLNYPKYCLDSVVRSQSNKTPEIKHSKGNIICYIIISYK